MTEQFLEEIKRELINGYSKKRHPFRYFALATISGDRPRQRKVVLRKLLDDLTILFYTDERSKKVSNIEDNQNVSALFYHPKKLMQVRLDGKAEIVKNQGELDRFWGNIQDSSKKDYITERAPGTTIKNPDNVEYLENENHFCAIKIVPDSIEYLRLKRPNHLRVLFNKTDNKWVGEFMVP
ncbi:MAG: pyridoxamine 5'-phosphate oxidase family protein [Bacteroidota bacterium]